ncbi:MAG: efflux RND transporter permease subunit, partial [Bacteroidales bacterium]
KAMTRGIAPARITENLTAAVSGKSAGYLHQEDALAPVAVRLQLSDSEKGNVNELNSLPVQNMMGGVSTLGDLAQVKEEVKEKSIWRKDQKRVVYVVAELAGDLESPVYAMLEINKKLDQLKVPEGYNMEVLNSAQPENEDNFSIKWDGEWQITYEVFRDLGLAFVIAILIIYLLIVGWFQNFLVPVVMLVAIPLSLVGIVVGHWMMGSYFSATSMIGFIALAGVMVRNSVLLIDFINIRLEQGIPLKRAVLEAGAVRTTPIVLTAGTVVLGAIVILFDPLFQGLAISLMGGTITSTILTLIVVPLLYYRMMRKKYPEAEEIKVNKKK